MAVRFCLGPLILGGIIMTIDKVIILDSLKKDLEKQINDYIDKYQGQYNLVQITNVNQDLMLCWSKVIPSNKHMGYQNKHLLENGNIRPQTEDKATSKQISYINSLAKRIGENVDTSNLTKREAGKLIGKLKKESKDYQQPAQEESDDINPTFNMDDVESMFDNNNN